MANYTYVCKWDHKKVETSIPAEVILHLANLFEGSGIDSTFAKVDADYSIPYDSRADKYTIYDSIVGYLADNVHCLGDDAYHWQAAVNNELFTRAAARYLDSIRASITAHSNKALQAYLLPKVGEDRYMRVLDPSDLRDLVKLSQVGRSTNHGKPYQPITGSGLSARFRDAVCYAYEQASYADHSRYIVPMDVVGPVNLEVSRKNLNNFLWSLKTHNGFAGSGCTWSGSLFEHDGQYIMVLDCRASISD